MNYKKAVWIFFAAMVVIELPFYLTNLSFKYSDYGYYANAVLIIAFAIFLIWIFKKKWQKIIFPILFTVLGGYIWLAQGINAAFACNQTVQETWKIEKYMISKGTESCLLGIGKRKYYLLERTLIGDFVTFNLEYKYLPKPPRNVPREIDCIIEFQEHGLKFNLCDSRLIQ